MAFLDSNLYDIPIGKYFLGIQPKIHDILAISTRDIEGWVDIDDF